MINYTERVRVLMQDIVARVEPLSFIDPASFSVFARFGRTGAEGAYATCHCLCMPPSDPGYYFWRNSSGEVTRRSEWFVSKTPEVYLGGQRLDYLISFALPRFCDQRLEHTRKRVHYPAHTESWIAKLDTVVHELYHIDPELSGIRRIEKEDGTYSANCHGLQFFEQVAEMVHTYLDSKPSPDVYDFLRHDFSTLNASHGGVVGTSFRTFPSFPQRYIERLEDQPPCESDGVGVKVEQLRVPQQPTRYTEDDLHVREFKADTSRRLIRKGQFRAA
jgi:hypothetical protein